MDFEILPELFMLFTHECIYVCHKKVYLFTYRSSCKEHNQGET